MSFLKPNKKKISIFFGLLVFAVAWIWFFFKILAQDIAGIVAVPLVSFPFAIFDFITFSYFAPECDGFIWCFPTSPQLIFVLMFDLVLLYGISCAFVSFTSRKKS